ncbi:MAG: hypothetical protein HFI33_00900 [Lachnospiraceae bacterium]|nr:hypothetical protein [Lachnospiraceae bacterium]
MRIRKDSFIPRWKKIVLSIVVIFFITRIGYIVRGEVDREYYTSADISLKDSKEIPCEEVSQIFTSDKARLHSIEFIVNNIAEDEKGIIVLSIYAVDELLYKTRIPLSSIKNNEWKRIYVNLPLKSEKYKISFNAQECMQIPNILLVDTSEASKESIESFIGEFELTGEVALKYGYMREVTIVNIGMCLLFWSVMLILLTIGLYYLEDLYGFIKSEINHLFLDINTDVVIIILEMICCLVILDSSGIEFQDPTKTIFYLISLCSAWRIKRKRAWIKEYQKKTYKKISLYFLYFYGAFSLVGQRILIYPLNRRVTLGGAFVFIITFLWFVPVIDSLVYLFGCLSNKLINNKVKQWKNIKFIIICSILLLLPAWFNLYANNPGISSRDTMICMVTNARHIRGMYDWHPAVYCIILRIILSIWDSTYAVIFVQHFFWLYVMLEGFLYLKKKYVSNRFLLLIAFLSGICAGNFLHLNTIWKDIPYALSLLWCLIILGKLSFDFEEYRRKWYLYVELFTALLGIYFYRKNGIVAFICILVPLIIFLRKNKKIWVTAGLIVTTIILVKGPVYKYLEIEDPGRYGMYIGLGQDILGAYYAGGEVSEETLQMITVMTGYAGSEYEYTPTWSRQAYNLDVPPMEFISSYLDTFINNPILMLRAVISREDALWSIYPGEDAVLGCVNYTDTVIGSEWNAYYPERKFNSFQKPMGEFTAYTANSQWISAIEWRCGLFTLLALVSVIVMIWLRGIKRYLLILTPVVGHMFSLLLSTGWSDFRYYWPLNLMNLFLLLFMILILDEGFER